jgi:hypothetical protein
MTTTSRSGQQTLGRNRWHQLVTRTRRERALILVVLAACVVTACFHTQRVTLVAVNDRDADACFQACGGSSSCSRACPGVIVEDGECHAGSERLCVSSREVNSAGVMVAVVGVGVLAIAGLMFMAESLLTPNI